MADCQTIDVSDIYGVASSQASEPTGDELEANVWGRLYPLHNAYSKVSYFSKLDMFSHSKLFCFLDKHRMEDIRTFWHTHKSLFNNICFWTTKWTLWQGLCNQLGKTNNILLLIITGNSSSLPIVYSSLIRSTCSNNRWDGMNPIGQLAAVVLCDLTNRIPVIVCFRVSSINTEFLDTRNFLEIKFVVCLFPTGYRGIVTYLTSLLS